MENVALEKARRDKREIAASYNVPETSIVWVGDNHYIVIKNGKEIRV